MRNSGFSPGRSRRYSLLHNVHIVSEIHPAYQPMTTLDSPLEESRVHLANNLSSTNVKVRNAWSSAFNPS